MHTHVNFKLINRIKVMYGGSRVNIKLSSTSLILYIYPQLFIDKLYFIYGIKFTSLRKQPTFGDATTGFDSPLNDVRETSLEIPY